MGPWLCSHGNRNGLKAKTYDVFALQWGRGCVATEMWPNYFAVGPDDDASMGPWLCSHGNWYQLVGHSAPARAASMGPWLCSHGNTLENLARSRTPDSFNGAVAV